MGKGEEEGSGMEMEEGSRRNRGGEEKNGWVGWFGIGSGSKV